MKENEAKYIAPGAQVHGDVSLKKGASIWYGTVIRAEHAPVTIGEDSNVQDACVMHTDPDFPVVIGKGVSVGHGAIVHGAKVGDNSLIGMGAILLNGSKIGKNCLIGAGALVREGQEIPDGSLAVGVPAKVLRSLSEQEIEGNRHNAKEYLELAEEYASGKRN